MAVQVPVAAPARQARLGGIRQAATWVTNARIGAAESTVYVSDGCTFPELAIGLCYQADPPTEEKTGVGLDQFTGVSGPFALYGGVDCFIGPDGDFDERARNILIQGEDRAIEQAVYLWANDVVDVPADDIVDAIAIMEQALDQDYLGRGILFMSRADAVRASAAMAIEYGIDGLPYTVNGTPVVASGWIPPGTVYATGAVTVLRSEVTEIRTIDHTTNHEWAVAEAVYAVLVDCDFRASSTWTTP